MIAGHVRASWRTAIRPIALPYLLSRLGVLAVGLAAAVWIGYDPAPSIPALWRISSNPVANLLARWDTFWYLDIATRGYHWTGDGSEQQNVVFFPALPTLMRVGGWLLGGHPLIAGLAISLSASLAAFVYLWRLVQERFGDRIATRTVALIAAYPFALYYSAVYTESLFLLGTVGAFYHARHRQWLRAAAWAALVGLTRPNGVLLTVPLLWMAVFGNDTLPAVPNLAQLRQLRPRWAGVCAAAVPALALVLYSAWLQSQVGDGLAWVSAQAAWPRIMPSMPWTAVARAATITPVAMPAASPVQVADVVVRILEVAALAFAAAAAWPIVRDIGVPFGILVGLNLLPPLAAHGLLSMGRFTSVMFPLFIWTARATTDRQARWLVWTFAIGQAVLTGFFFTWRNVV